jgi:hypothetical protein
MNYLIDKTLDINYLFVSSAGDVCPFPAFFDSSVNIALWMIYNWLLFSCMNDMIFIAISIGVVYVVMHKKSAKTF